MFEVVYEVVILKRNSRQNATWAFFFVNVYESNLPVKAYLRRKTHF